MQLKNGFLSAATAGVLAAFVLLVLTADAKGPAKGAPAGPGADKVAPPAPREPVARLKARLSGFEEVPAVVTPGNGTFQATLEDGMLSYQLQYADTLGAVLQAHIHVGQPGVNGGVAIFLCSNLGNGPEGTQECPPAPGEITGLVTAADVVGPTSQGVAPGDLAAVWQAIQGGVSYVNVHTELFPGGEIRGRLRVHDRGRGPRERDKGSPAGAFLDGSVGTLD
jgi:hypothetical protein